jgi:oxygen-independent coproporphyrinogen-3 oxidase
VCLYYSVERGGSRCYDPTEMSECRSLYVHLPFCRAKCAYCDFNSYARQEHLIPAYVDALLREATLWAEPGAVGRVETLYFGGGTPSLLPIAETRRLLDGLRQRFDVAGDAEVTMEANPESVDATHLRTLRRLGVNRLSLGLQSFDDAELHFLGRIHDAARAERAYCDAREAAFDSVSVDLIFGLPGQTVAQWRRSLERAIALGPDHLSLYALTLEEGTPLARRVATGECPESDPDVQADMYTWSSERLAAAGYEQYEISNWAKPGHRCSHNLTYWHSEPYLGLGAGAHSYVDGYRLANERAPERYIELVAAGRGERPWDPTTAPHVESVEHPDAEREMSDAVILGLRLTEGVSLQGLSERFGVDLGERYDREIDELAALGLLESVDGRIRLTERGRLLGNEAFQRFLL